MKRCGDGSDVIFYDGFLYVISVTGEYEDIKHSLDFLCITPQYDEPMSLKDIAERYPKVKKVLYENYMVGGVYNYGNHEPGIWERVGSTVGFA